MARKKKQQEEVVTPAPIVEEAVSPVDSPKAPVLDSTTMDVNREENKVAAEIDNTVSEQEAQDLAQSVQPKPGDALQTPLSEAPQIKTPTADEIKPQRQIEDDRALTSMHQENLQQQRYFADMMQEIKDQYEAEKAETEEDIRDKQRAARFAGATELATSIANLIGVGSFGASNQTYKQYSHDWMRQADAAKERGRARLGSLRDRQRAYQMQIEGIRQQGRRTAMNYQLQREANQIRQQQAAAKAAYDAKKQALDAQFNAGKLAVSQYNAETARMKAERDAEIKAGDQKTRELVARSTINRNNAQADKYRSGGSGSRRTYSFLGQEYGNTKEYDEAVHTAAIKYGVSPTETTGPSYDQHTRKKSTAEIAAEVNKKVEEEAKRSRARDEQNPPAENPQNKPAEEPQKKHLGLK